MTALRLKRVRNILANPRVSLVIDDYSEDWETLAYVLIQGSAEIVADHEEQRRVESLLREKYPQYGELLEKGSPVLKISPGRVVSWGSV